MPIAGPWIQLAVKPTAFDSDDRGTWLIFDGLLQAAGAALLIAGIATSGGDEEPALSILPSAGPHHAGLSLAGRF
ncbi:hypothetical protein [Sandaracinus amylolyticus]|uniref:Uncharacterized protein n=1 Tax=Sandaracinus amylolyticus TaxID=927083 RepID=A0A0F6YLE1_9BACT|nr:hypothetical protein [Sandaracinus amylolyticus]AKF10282.1 hypothetical protein DB32_007431 [Sandaracinus amylolyticus]